MIIAVVGPTGVGKTKMSLELAKKYNGIIVNCDAMQVYKEMNIGTAKVTEEEKEGIPHYLFNILSVKEEYSVYNFQHDLRDIINKYSDNNIIIVGGTGLYLKAGLFDYNFATYQDKKDYEGFSDEELHNLVIKKDPLIDIHVNNRRRMINYLNREHEKKAFNFYMTLFLLD